MALVAVSHVALFHTRFGLALRAAGENPRAAEAAGIDVARMRYLGVLISGGAAGLSGAYTILAEVGLFRETIVSGQGFIALAIVILGGWSPWKVALGAFLFGGADALQLSLQMFGARLPPQILLSLPYVLTIIAISGVFGRRAAQPAALMQPVRENLTTFLGSICDECHPRRRLADHGEPVPRGAGGGERLRRPRRDRGNRL